MNVPRYLIVTLIWTFKRLMMLTYSLVLFVLHVSSLVKCLFILPDVVSISKCNWDMRVLSNWKEVVLLIYVLRIISPFLYKVCMSAYSYSIMPVSVIERLLFLHWIPLILLLKIRYMSGCLCGFSFLFHWPIQHLALWSYHTFVFLRIL